MESPTDLLTAEETGEVTRTGIDYQKGADSVQPESGNTPLGLCKIYKRWFTNTESATRV